MASPAAWEAAWDRAAGVLQQPQLPGVGDGLGAVGHLELGEQVADVALDGIEADHQLRGDGLVELPAASSLSTSRSRALRRSRSPSSPAWRSAAGSNSWESGRRWGRWGDCFDHALIESLYASAALLDRLPEPMEYETRLCMTISSDPSE